MRGRPLHICWRHTADELAARLDGERDPRRRVRLQALLMVRQGATLQETSKTLGLNYRSLQRWVTWYRAGSVEAVLERVPGHAAPGRPSKLTPSQTQELLYRVEIGELSSIREARDWVADYFGIAFAYTGMHGLLRRVQRAEEEGDARSAEDTPNPHRQRDR